MRNILPIERVLSAAREAGQTGKRLTIQDIQAKEGLEPSDVSKAVGSLKKEGAVLIVQGGCIESTGRTSPTAEAMRALLQELRSGQRELQHLCRASADCAPAACGEARECARAVQNR